ncbi:ferritin family protein [Laceyella putida]|uniref:Ferritin family protein n=1 Tax=Laceyella putida TaxID=110101 RepID=A0ABW2RPK1_9BACL
MYAWTYQSNRAYMYKDLNKFLQDLLKAASGEAQAIDFYTRVVQIAPTDKARRDFQHALEDEKEHYQSFTNLYTSLTGKRAPVPPFQPVQFKDYANAVEKAVEDELEAYEMYRDMYLSTSDPVARDILLKGFTDEGEHAIRFTYQRALL